MTTSQGQPLVPVKVTVDYDADLLRPGARPLILHGDTSLGRWRAEATNVDPEAPRVSAAFSSFSFIDVVDSITWGAGVITGNRSDLPTDCRQGPAPPWLNGISLSMNRNDALTACISNKTTDETLRLNVVNNRGFAQLLRVSGVGVNVGLSLWPSSIEAAIARGLARVASPTNSTHEFVLASGTSATIAIPRPTGLVGSLTATIVAADKNWTAAAALVFNLLKAVDEKRIGSLSSFTDCVLATLDFSRSATPQAAQTVAALRACVDKLAALKTTSEKSRLALKQIAAAILVTDLFYKLVDGGADGAYPGRAEVTFQGLASVNRLLQPEGLALGAIPAGSATQRQLGASGGVPPYRFRISSAAANAGRVPSWAALAGDGRVTLSPPPGTSGDFGFYVVVEDGNGQSSAFAHWELTFSVVAGNEGAPACTARAVFKDINPGPAGSAPGSFRALSVLMLFAADDGEHGRELFRSDGTPAGTGLVRDIAPGSAASGPSELVTAGGRTFFFADDGVHGRELWVTDGTSAGTFLAGDIRPGSAGSAPHDLAAGTASFVYFWADDGSGADSLYRSDGTQAGTFLIKRVALGSNYLARDTPRSVMRAVAGSRLYFSAADPVGGFELWTSDGTSAGTHMVSDIRSGGDSNPLLLTAFGDSVFFFADNGANGYALNYEPWVSDGTAAGTFLLKDIASEPWYRPSSMVWRSPVISAGQLYFAATDNAMSGTQLWRTDGTPAGTQLTWDLSPLRDQQPLAATGSGVIYTASNSGFLRYVPASGTPPIEVKQDWPTPGYDPYPFAFHPVGDGGFFWAYHGELYFYLWRTDGTSAGTARVAGPFPSSSYPSHYGGVGDAYFFRAPAAGCGEELHMVRYRP